MAVRSVRAYVFETRGGALLQEVFPASAPWSAVANKPETVTLNLDLTSTQEKTRGWANLGTPWKHSFALDIGGRLFGGPIMPHDFDDNASSLKVTARGFRALLDRRSILKLAALTQSLILPNGTPDAFLDTNLSGFDLGTIGKKIVEQACLWPGWDDIPIVFPADRAGTHQKNWPAVERTKVGPALTALSGVENGPDFRFQLEWDGPDRFRWVFNSGTQEQPRLQGTDVFAWQVDQGSGLKIQTDPTLMGSLAWSQGGRANDTTLIRSLYDPTLIDAGFPMLELETSASLNVVDESTLDSWNEETLRTAHKPWEFWSFRIRADRSPLPTEYNLGDLINVIVTKSTPIAGGYVLPGEYTRRIVQLSGDLDGWINVTCGENYG